MIYSVVTAMTRKDSTRIPHILEHSVLCGSRKHPLKEPFVELLKGSLHTFLNAFTYPDRTCYLVASTNAKDFYNLVDVYLDAVFFPKCVEDIHTFQQEGWHHELNDPSDDIINIYSAEKPRSNGVVFEDSNGVNHWAYLNEGSNNEILVTAGVLGSPQLLMLSGIGLANHLRANGIEVILDQPMVGQGMADNPMNALFIPSTEPLEISLIQTVGITPFGSFVEAASGTIELNWTSSLPQELLNQTEQVYGVAREQQRVEVKAAVDSYLASSVQGGIILEKIMGPASSGHLELKTLDAKDNPEVTFNYFSNPQDLQKCVKGMEKLRNG